MTASTRRAALGAILAAPPASVPAGATVSAPASNLAEHEAELLALAPRLIPLLDEFDRLWSQVAPFYEAWERASKRLRPRDWQAMEQLPEWAAYIEARRPADELDHQIEALYEPYMNVSVNILAGIMLKHRYGVSIDAFRDDALTEPDRLWRARACI